MTKPSDPRAARSSSSKSKKSTSRRTAAQRKPAASDARKASIRARPEQDGSSERVRSARIIAVANQKGGVGKSTTAVSLGAALAELGHKVLVVDLDPQGNASTGLGIRHEARDVTVYDVLAAEAPIENAIVPTQLDNLFAIPSTIDLAGAEIELVSQFSRELRLRKAIEPLRHDAYDYVFLDCPPSLGLLTVNALAAAEELIVPIQCEYYALEGLGQLLRNVRLVQQNVNTNLRLTGIVMTMFDSRTKLSEQVVAEVRKYFGDRVYRSIIPRTVRLSEAPGFGLPITSYDPSSKGADSYRQLAREVDERLPDESPLPAMEEIPEVVVPPPEPPVARAPRPLVRSDDPSPEQDEVDVETTVLDASGGDGGEPGSPSEVDDEAPRSEDVTLDEVSMPDPEPEGEPSQPGGPAMAQVELTEAGEAETTRPRSDVEGEPDGDGARPGVEPPAPIGLEPSAQVEDHTPDESTAADGSSEPNGDAQPEVQEEQSRAGKRLRGLFRRGGRS